MLSLLYSVISSYGLFYISSSTPEFVISPRSPEVFVCLSVFEITRWVLWVLIVSDLVVISRSFQYTDVGNIF